MPWSPPAPPPPPLRVTMASSYADKLALFRARFACRTDVWSRRWTSVRTGRSGYAIACGNEWRPGFCAKPGRGCSACRNSAWIPLTDEIVRWHLCGRTPSGKAFSLGGYPILPGDDCRFACVLLPGIFGGASGFSDATPKAILAAAAGLGAQATATSAYDGAGVVLWWFFLERVPAGYARDLVSAVLTAARRTRAGIPLDVWDGVFPEQATLPVTGPGNAVPLPLQGDGRRRGRGVFLNPGLAPVADPWVALSEASVLSADEVERIVESSRGRIYPVNAVVRDRCETPRPRHEDGQPRCRGPCAKRPGGLRIECLLSNRLRMSLKDLPPGAVAELEETAAFLNPVFDDAERMRRPVRGIPRIASSARREDGQLSLPRGCIEAAIAVLRAFGATVRGRDVRESGDTLDVAFHGELRSAQVAAAKAMMRHDCGVLEAGTAFGKTVLAAWMVAKRGRGTLVLVNRRTLQRQWVARLAQFLGLRKCDIGCIGGGAKRKTGRIDVALLQTLARLDVDALRAMRYGFVIVDECHGLPAPTFERVTDALCSRYFLGLSATPVRRDGRHPVIVQQCGPVRHIVPASERLRTEPFRHVVIVRETAFHPSAEQPRERESGDRTFAALCSELCADDERNGMIVADALACLGEGRNPVVLSDRRGHVALLAEALREQGIRNVVELVGGLGSKALEAAEKVMNEAPSDEGRVIVATGSLLGEGFDNARLDTLLLATPLSWRGRLAQYAGRLHRLYEGKREVRIYDYADLEVPMLTRMFKHRCEAYGDIGYIVRMPAEAVPGWPVEVALPDDPVWHGLYGESTQQLCLDGVDAELARLFVRAAYAREPEDDEGAAHARSDAEAFLFQRLETLPATRGRFELNASLPIPFGGAAAMEVDFLCRDRRLAVEIDGKQHLTAESYRRDREKDRALQRRGWLVVRFLAYDVVARLRDVLSTLLSLLQPG